LFNFRPDGRKYEGEFSEGKQHGEGLFTEIGNQPKRGLWKDGKRTHWL